MLTNPITSVTAATRTRPMVTRSSTESPSGEKEVNGAYVATSPGWIQRSPATAKPTPEAPVVGEVLIEEFVALLACSCCCDTSMYLLAVLFVSFFLAGTQRLVVVDRPAQLGPQLKALGAISRKSLAPVSALVRKAVTEFLNNDRKPRKPKRA